MIEDKFDDKLSKKISRVIIFGDFNRNPFDDNTDIFSSNNSCCLTLYLKTLFQGITRLKPSSKGDWSVTTPPIHLYNTPSSPDPIVTADFEINTIAVKIRAIVMMAPLGNLNSIWLFAIFLFFCSYKFTT